jgi:NTP pyrophosphatase (non-canonical NTP hydrolase)
MTDLSFTMMREANERRCCRWHGEDWISPEDPWTLADWANAMGGEGGEAQNAIKKIRRIDTSLWDKQLYPGDSETGSELAQLASTPARLVLIEKLADELADMILYADLLATKAGIDLGEAVRSKFNRVSHAQGFPERL